MYTLYTLLIIFGIILIIASYFQGYVRGAEDVSEVIRYELMHKSAEIVVLSQMSALNAACAQGSDDPFAYTVGGGQYVKVFKDKAEIVSKEQYEQDRKYLYID